MKLKKYTEEQLRQAVKDNPSYRKILEQLNVAPYGGNYDTLRKAIVFFNLDTSHFTGQSWSKGKTLKPKRQVKEYLDNTFPIGSHKLRLRLLKEKILKPQCSSCKKKKWLGKPIPLELDHIDGDNKNNKLENLRLLCPNCHAFTPTYRGKNKSSKA